MTGKRSLRGSLRCSPLSPQFTVCFAQLSPPWVLGPVHSPPAVKRPPPGSAPSRQGSAPDQAPPPPGQAPPPALQPEFRLLRMLRARGLVARGLLVLAAFTNVVFPRLVCVVASVRASGLFTTK